MIFAIAKIYINDNEVVNSCTEGAIHEPKGSIYEPIGFNSFSTKQKLKHIN